MRALLLGDIVGLPGRKTVQDDLARIRTERGVDLVVANGENASGGFGLTAKHAKRLLASGVDAITGGNHTWKHKNLYPLLDDDPRLLRPHNYGDFLPGTGVRILKLEGAPPVAVVNLLGRTFMPPIDCPFAAAEAILDALPEEVNVVLVDFHAEATGEKIAMAYFLDGRASAVVGTHTHVQTADARIQPGGTGAVTDLGMCGAVDSCLGMKPEIILDRYLTGLPRRLESASGSGVLQGAIFDIDDTTGRAIAVELFRSDRPATDGGEVADFHDDNEG